MTQITRFEIKKLHGFRDYDLKLKDNTLILVGENGAGKTTVLHLFYYLLSGQWSSMAKYQFESVTITIDSKSHTLRYSDIEKSLKSIDHRILRRLPSNIRHRFLVLLEQTEGRLVTGELEMLCAQYDIPLHYLLSELDLFENTSETKKENILTQTLNGIQKSLKAQLLYLPTYRRIEQELNLIFKGLDERELSNRRHLLASRRGETFVELVEFGMKDVESAINETRAELDKFARENLNTLTFSYLGDIVEEKYQSVELDPIKQAEAKTIDNILNRIPEPILSLKNKQHLRKIIEQVKTDQKQNVHAKVICHYFTKLMAFHEELGTREAKIVSFCKACNDYMVDKEFRYDTSNFTFTIEPKADQQGDRGIKLQYLSSGEKQIVSLFSHLYLSGGKSYFVLIDEPELSLSVPWQRKFLADIRKAEFCVGLVAVTHSPFIYENELKKYAHGLGEFIL
ncbi:AAA family ATPase [Methyloglobulus sp.]|uniref:AAA family ATPase n=1 Tax=Methyloglobulus sp. TaxID=2518622 RepID=UPI00398909AA